MKEQTAEEREKIAKSNEEYSILDELFATEKVAQVVILGVTTHLAVIKYMKDEKDTLLFQSALTTLVAFVAGCLVSYRTRMVNNGLWGSDLRILSDFLPSFNVIYLLFLPFTMSLLFGRDLALVNGALAFNCTDVPFYMKLPLQAIFVLLNDEYYSDRERNIKAVVLNVVLCFLLEKIGELKSFDVVDCNLFSILLTNVLYLVDSPSLHFQVLQKSMYGLIAAMAVNFVGSLVLSRANKLVRSFILFSSFSVVFPYTIIKTLRIDGQNPAFWLYEYITSDSTRMNIICGWIVCLLILLPNVMIFQSNFSLNTSRKVWHFVILALLVKPLQWDAEFVKISIAGTIVLFLIVEYLRYLKLAPIGDFLDKKLRSFADFRDERGPIIISYVYLIIGVATPILINGSLVGVISLGVGDSLASIVGHRWGRIRWPGTNKTLEGTLAFILATTGCSLYFKQRYGEFEGVTVSNVILTCVLSGILEGNSVLNDNILIPAFMLIFIEICKS